ncbi:MAG: DUF1513 domain-containing protein [Pseudomonadota bacterium]
MAIDRGLVLERRQFVKAAGALFATGLVTRQAEALAHTEVVFAAATIGKDRSYGAAIFDERGQILHQIDLPGRGHDVTANKLTGDLVVFARRPGTFAIVFGRTSQPRLISSPPARHFYGHGTFSADGRLLYATENDYENALGKIGIYDATDGYTRLGEFDSYGIGPHEIALMPDGQTLLVANGGIETHPDYGRQKLNLPTMQSTIAKIDTQSGHLISAHRLPDHLDKISLRHLAIDAQGTAYLGGQAQGDFESLKPIVWRMPDENDPTPLNADDPLSSILKGYVSSVGLSDNGTQLAV